MRLIMQYVDIVSDVLLVCCVIQCCFVVCCRVLFCFVCRACCYMCVSSSYILHDCILVVYVIVLCM